jgi:VWFA-related protein
MHPSDECFLMTFNVNAIVRQGFTHNPVHLFDALDTVAVGGGTALISSVTEAAQKMGQATNRKHALIVISDGGDLFATAPEVQAFQNRVAGLQTLIYAIQMQDVYQARSIARTAASSASSERTVSGNTAAFRPDLAKDLMQAMANESGGRYFSVKLDTSPAEVSRQLNSALDEIFIELRGQYTIGFYPRPDAKAPGRVRVQTVNPAYRVRMSAVQTSPPDTSESKKPNR